MNPFAFIKYFFMVLCSAYIFKKLLNIQIRPLHILLDSVYAAILAAFTVNVNGYIPWVIFVIVLLSCLINSMLYKLQISVSFVSGFISFGLAYLAFILAAIVTLPLIFLLSLRILTPQNVDFATKLLAGVLQMAFAAITFQFSRLKNGMPYLQQNKTGWFGVILGMFMLLAVSLFAANPWQDVLIPFYIVILAEGGFFLIMWWRQKIIDRYNERIRRKQLEDARAETQQVSAERSVLKLDNSGMSKVIHNYSRMIKAICVTCVKLLRAATFPDESMRQEADAFIQYVCDFSETYSLDLFSYNNQAKPLPKTGLAGVDGMIELMAQSAFRAGVSFDFSFSGRVRAFVQETVHEVDLTNLIGNLVQNAIVAVGGCDSRTIVVYLSRTASGFCLDVMDSGIPFPRDVLDKLGKERVTSHADSGGSGIGMMTVFEILHKYAASLVLTEYPPGGAFSKKLSVCFDGQNRFIIGEDYPEVRTPKETGHELVTT